VSWKNGGGIEQRVPIEDFVLNKKENAAMKRGPWLYTGSLIAQGVFLAQRELSIAALVIDPVALINNPRPGNRDDTNWEINAEKIPPAGTPVEITIRLESAEKQR